eukprot:c19082_g1_i1 orf=471-3578(+)
MLAEPSLCRHLQWCAHDSLLPRCGPIGSKSRACAGGGKEKKQKNQKPSPSPRYLLFGRVYEDEYSDSDGDRMSSLASAFSDTASTSATLTSERLLEQQPPTSSNSNRVRKRDTLTRELLAMEPFDSTPVDQMRDEDLWHFRHGPLPGDLAEVEAFCRIFRIAEQVHNAVMDSLRVVNDARELVHSQSDGYNGSILVDPESLEAQDVPLLEQKVVSGLGCIGALLHQQKQEVLGGRLNVGFTPMARHDSMPPLARFRAEMKRCCEELEALLLCYFPADDDQFTAMHKKFQKLCNICLDAGYPRAEGSPSHADIPNWGAVKSRTPWNEETSDRNSEVAFWRGGQLTDDGLQWLIDKGFKVIVDMRAEDSAHYLAKSAMAAAIASGKLKCISLPIDPGSNPTKDQVMEFAKLVADSSNAPLYLHSLKGVGRTSAMVSRWREIGLSSSLEDQALSDPSNSYSSYSRADKKLADNVYQWENEAFDEIDVRSSTRSIELVNDNSLEVSGNQKVRLQVDAFFSTPFEAQRPVANYFSKQDMSKFLKGRKVSPGSFQRKRNAKAVISGGTQVDEADVLLTSSVDPAGRWRLGGPGIPRAGKKEKKSDVTNGDTQSRYTNVSVDADSAENLVVGNDESTLAASPVDSTQGPREGALVRDSGIDGGVVDDHDDVTIVGDMCASTTGVVRLQSRKKAEMYLVRTDGFSCTREKVKESTLAFTHPSTQQQMLMWKTVPKTVLLLKKLGAELMQEAQQVASFLHYKEGMDVIVEPDVHDRFARVSGFGFIQTFHNQDTSNLHERVDFVVCLGGDGVILHASNIFRNAVPPVVSFNLGSLGFLTAHPFEDFMQDLRAIIHGNTMVEGVYITLRMRLRCELFRNGKSVPGKVFDVLNEVVVDRGSNPYLCKIECYERNRLITKVQADGVIVATPTGSTAYSTAAGGSMVHPNVPCMLFTPICPHSLSFRPVILPDSALLELKVPEDARSNAWVSFDGKRRQQLSRGDSVRICMSQHPLPTVNKSDQTDDWFQSLVRCLNWNERLEQKALP